MPRPTRTRVAPSTSTSDVAKPVQPRDRVGDTGPVSAPNFDNLSDDSDRLVTRALPSGKRKRKRPSDPSLIVMSGALGLGDVRLEKPCPRTKSARAQLQKTAKDAENAKLIEALKKRKEQRAQLHQAAQLQVPATREESAKGAEEHEDLPKGRSVPNTPAMEHSVLSIANFKRRPRQPSILRRAHAGQGQVSATATDNEDDDFHPNDESTPAQLGKSHTDIHPDDISRLLGSSPPPSNPRKRKSTSPHRSPRSSPPLRSSPMRDTEDRVPSSPSLPPTLSRVDQPRDTTPPTFSQTMAPPESTASSQEFGREKPQPLPSSPTATRRSRQKPGSSLTTANLQDLLPRRRRRRRAHSEYSMSSASDDQPDLSHLGAHDDELSHLPASKRLRTQKPAPKTPAPTTKKPLQTLNTKKTKPATKVTKTYTRRGSSDKENLGSSFAPDANGDDSHEHVTVAQSKTSDVGNANEGKKVTQELSAARSKFEKVDEWQLEYESVEGDNSQLKDAR
ncbi:MAG: hypothetical protein M1833_006072 [Piccolia ochrophora]|nr:MAG: hypothetical protein M1833_006072 [Piccolia ochrophora]